MKSIILTVNSINYSKNSPSGISVSFKMSIKGFIYVMIDTISADKATSQIKAQLSIGQVIKTETASKQSGSSFNEIFLMEVPHNPSILELNCTEGQKNVGGSRYDLTPFFPYEGIMNSLESDLYDEQSNKVGKIKLKITFYSARHGKLRIRIFDLELAEGMVEQFKQAKIKVRFGIHAQTTSVRPLTQKFDEVVQVIVLLPTMNLSFDLVHQMGLLATYNIPNAQQGKMLNNEIKAYQVSLFNNDKAVALIKYQLEWIKPQVAQNK